MTTTPNRAMAARVAVEAVDGRIRVTDLAASSYLRPRLVGRTGTKARVALVGACAALLAGDDLRLEVEVGPGAHLELVEPTGTVAYDGRGERASWGAAIRVHEAGSLVWPGAPFVVADGADVCRHTGIALDTGAVILLQETLVLGRSGEAGGHAGAPGWTPPAGDRPAGAALTERRWHVTAASP